MQNATIHKEAFNARRKSAVLLAVSVMALALFNVVGGITDKAQAQTELPGEGKAAIRLVNLSPDAGAVDLYFDGAIAGANIDLREASDYLIVNVDTSIPVTLSVVPTGKTEDDAIFGPVEKRMTDDIRLVYVLSGSVKDDDLSLVDILDSAVTPDQVRVAFSNDLAEYETVAVRKDSKDFIKILKLNQTASTRIDPAPVTFEVVSTTDSTALITIENELIPNVSYTFFLVDLGDGPEAVTVAAVSDTLATPDEDTDANATVEAGGRSQGTPRPTAIEVVSATPVPGQPTVRIGTVVPFITATPAK